MAYIYYISITDSWTGRETLRTRAYSNYEKCATYVDELLKKICKDRNDEVDRKLINDSWNELIEKHSTYRIDKKPPERNELKELSIQDVIETYASWKLHEFDLQAMKFHRYNVTITRLKLD